MVIKFQGCHHDFTADAAMTSVRNDDGSDVSSAYQRAIAREEKAGLANQRIAAVDPSPLQAKTEIEVDADSDLYRHHSQQQSLEGG